jgi:hypothetical protein
MGKEDLNGWNKKKRAARKADEATIVTEGQISESTISITKVDKHGNPLSPGLIPWQPGQSGNPGGRRPIPPEIIEALELGSLDAAKRLVALTQDLDGRVALTAIDMLQNRLYGRAQQQADVKVTTTNVQQAHLQVLLELQAKREDVMKTIEGDTQRVEVHDPSISND